MAANLELPVPQAGRGHFIVVEGLDRSGKTSQCQALHDTIKQNGGDVRLVKFPDRTTLTGGMINSYLQGTSQQDDHAIHLLFSANRWEAVNGMLRDLEAGVTLIVDRYSFSGAVYSAAKQNPALSLDWAWNPEIGLPKPDLLVFLDISEEDAALRGGYGEERYEKVEMQRAVRELFKVLFRRIPNLPVHTINAGQSLNVVSDQVWHAYSTLKPLFSIPETLEELQRTAS